MYQLGKQENIWNRPTESGNRWQTSGAFGIGGDGVMRWVQIAANAGDMPNLEEAITALGVERKK